MKHPAFMRTLIRRLQDDLEAEVGAEIVGEKPRQYLLTVFSPKFRGRGELKRQDAVWDIVNEVCTPEESLQIVLIWTFVPGEVFAFVDSLGGESGAHRPTSKRRRASKTKQIVA